MSDPPVDGSSRRVGIFGVDASRNLLTLGSNKYKLEPRIMDVLCALAQLQGRVMARDDLINQVWGVHFGGEESLSRAIYQLRKTFKAAGVVDEYIETIPKRGYRLVQPVSGFDTSGFDTQEMHSGPARYLPEQSVATELKPGPLESYSVAVIPFESSGGNDEEFLADGIGRDLVAMLSRAPHLRVAAYSNVLRGRMNEVEVRDLGRLLGIRYIVSGSLIRRGERLILRVSLIDSLDNTHILSWKLDEAPQRFLADLDAFILDLSTPILSEIQVAEALLAHRHSDSELDAYKVIRSTEMLRSVYSQKRARDIVSHLENLIEQFPGNAWVHGSLAVQLAQNVVSGWSDEPVEDVASAREHVDSALGIAPDDADVLASAGIVALMMRDEDQAIHLLTRSLRRNPNNPHVMAALGWQRCLRDGDEEGIAMILTAEKRAPHHPRYGIWAHYRGISLTYMNRFEEAAAAFRQSIERNPDYHLIHLGLAGALVHLQRYEEARTAVARALKIAPDYTLQHWFAVIDVWPGLAGKNKNKAEYMACLRRVWPA